MLSRYAARAGAGLLALGAGLLLLGTAASTSLAAPPASSSGYTLFGDATLVHPGHNSPTAVNLTSTCPGGPGDFSTTGCFAGAHPTATYSGIDFAVPAGTTVSDITQLSTDYMFTAGSCGGGSPRFQINVNTTSGTKNIQVYIGPPPNYTGCPQNTWLNTGNLVTPASLVDASQLPGGTFYEPWSAVVAAYGSDAVTGIQLVADGGWSFPPNYIQTVLIDNTQINNTTYTYESAESCKNGGWQQFTSAPGPFKNQGDCVSYFASGGKNPGNG